MCLLWERKKKEIMSKMESDERVWNLRGTSDYYVDVVVDGPIIEIEQEIKVVPQSELIRVQGLLRKVGDFLNNEIATLECESRVRTVPEEVWETAMYLRDLIDLENRK